MKILCVGDFDGRFPKKYLDIIRREKIDLVVSDGDYPPFSLKKEFFEYVYASIFDIELWEVVGKKKYKEKVTADHKAGEDVLKKLNKLPIPVFTVLGNHDHPFDDVMDMGNSRNDWKWDRRKRTFFSRVLKKYKHIRRIDYRYAKFKDYIFIGARGSSFSGEVESKAFKKHKKILEGLFKRFAKENKKRKVIFVSHNSPYNTKLDKVTAKDAHEIAKGKHVGSKMFKQILKKYQPILSISGHIDESWGKQKLGKTLAINCGAVHDGRGAIIEIKDKKINVKFIG